MQFGGHLSSAGGIYTAIDRIEAIGGDCVQVFTQSPRMWKPTAHKPEAIERFKERRAEAGIGGVVCHALYLINLASADFCEKSATALQATLDTAGAIEADAVIFHVGSHLGAGFDSSLDQVARALGEILDGYDGAPWLAMENSAGPGDTIGRSIGELATLVDALDRDRHANILEGEIGEGLGAFLAHPAFQDLCAYMEVPGTGEGPNKNEMAKIRALHARWTAL